MRQDCFLFRAMLVVLLLFVGAPFSQAQENSDSWEVEIIKNTTNEVVKSGLVNTNSFSLDGLESNVEYFTKIRTKNTFFSDWVVSDVFMLDNGSMTIRSSIGEKDLLLSSDKGQLFISSEVSQQANIYTVDGCLLRSVPLSIGNPAVVALAKGLYIVNGQKIVVK